MTRRPSNSLTPHTTHRYGLTMLVSNDESLQAYLEQILKQLSNWLMQGEVQKLVVVVNGIESGETLERWVFNVEHDGEAKAAGPESGGPPIRR